MGVRLLAGVATLIASAGVLAQVPPPPPVPPAAPRTVMEPQQSRDSQAQAQAPATALIMGTVVVNGTGQPADGVRVTLSGNDRSRSAITDDSGNFALLALPPGTYTLRATKNRWVSGTYGQKQPGRPGTAIVLNVGQQLKGISLEVARGGVVSGTIFDEKNRPAIGVSVRVMQWSWQSGERTLNQTGSGTTDDRGIYRVFGLSPGEYLVNAVPPNNSANMFTTEDMQSLARMEELMVRGMAAQADMTKLMAEREFAVQPNSVNSEPVSGYAAVYYPGTAQAGNAQAVKVGISQEQLGIDFQLQRVPLSRVTGSVVVPNGVTPNSVQVRLVDIGSPMAGTQQFSARPNPQGMFTFNAVPPGQYQMSATATMPVTRTAVPAGATPEAMQIQMKMDMDMGGGSGGRRLWAVQDVSIDGAYTPNVQLTLQEGMTITGGLSFDGTTPQPPQLNRVRLTLSPLGQAMQSSGIPTLNATADTNGRFTFIGVSPGHYRIRATGASGWTTRSVVADGKDTLDFPLEVKPGENLGNVNVEFGDKFTDLKGTLQGPTGQPTADFTVIIFPGDSRLWVPNGRRIRSTRPSTDGKFAFGGLPAGDYRIAAVTDVEPGAWYDPALLQQLLAASISVRLVEGQPVVQDVRVSGG